MYKPKYFKLYELLPPEIYKNEYEGWKLLDERLLETIDVVREIINKPLICNTWYQGGDRVASGFRSANCKVGAEMSQHRLGRAVDLVCAYMSASEMRDMIKEHQEKLPYKVRIEDGVTWLHIDVKNRNDVNKIQLF